MAHAYDPHSDYFGKAMTDRFNDEMQLSLVGIGAAFKTMMTATAKLWVCFRVVLPCAAPK